MKRMTREQFMEIKIGGDPVKAWNPMELNNFLTYRMLELLVAEKMPEKVMARGGERTTKEMSKEEREEVKELQAKRKELELQRIREIESTGEKVNVGKPMVRRKRARVCNPEGTFKSVRELQTVSGKKRTSKRAVKGSESGTSEAGSKDS